MIIALIYIDPPFDEGADFTMQVLIGEGEKIIIIATPTNKKKSRFTTEG
jgi:hypothetical protein